MDLWEAMQARHAVRSYTPRAIEGETLEQLCLAIDAGNKESGLNMQLCLDAPEVFGGLLARYGRFEGVNNYLALVGKKEDALEETCGYHGEKIVLRAQQLGLNTCWVAATYSKGKSLAKVAPGEKLLMVICVGYGQTQGEPHKGKPVEALYSAPGTPPPWFLRGVQAAALAPTATNQQKFHFTLNGNRVQAAAGTGFYVKTDLGIVKYHFELGAGDAGWQWA